LLGAAFGFEEAAGVGAGGQGAFGFGVFGGGGDGLGSGAADNLCDIAFDGGIGFEFGFGVDGSRCSRFGGFGDLELGFGDLVADAFEGVERGGGLDLACQRELADFAGDGGGHLLCRIPVPGDAARGDIDENETQEDGDEYVPDGEG